MKVFICREQNTCLQILINKYSRQLKLKVILNITTYSLTSLRCWIQALDGVEINIQLTIKVFPPSLDIKHRFLYCRNTKCHESPPVQSVLAQIRRILLGIASLSVEIPERSTLSSYTRWTGLVALLVWIIQSFLSIKSNRILVLEI